MKTNVDYQYFMLQVFLVYGIIITCLLIDYMPGPVNTLMISLKCDIDKQSFINL